MRIAVAAAALIALAGVSADASGYPASYTYQTARVVSRGPALVARVSSGIMSALVIGYKGRGVLGRSESIQAWVRTTFENKAETRVITMQREWHGTGFMTRALSGYELGDDGHSGDIMSIELAFFSGPRWDSDYGANYVFGKWEFSDTAARFTWPEPYYSQEIEIHCWDFIVDQMRR